MIGSSSTGAAFSRLAERRAGRDLERQRRRVDIVVGAVDQRHLQVDHGKPASTPEVRTEFTPFSTPGMYSFGTDAADDLVLELEAGAGLVRLDRRT